MTEKTPRQIIEEAIDATFMQRGMKASVHADAVLMALAEHGFSIVFDPLQAVKDFKTWPQDVRKELGCKD